MGLTVSQSPSSACAHIPTPFHDPDWFTVSTCCTYIDLGSRRYFGVNTALVVYYVYSRQQMIYEPEPVRSIMCIWIRHKHTPDLYWKLFRAHSWLTHWGRVTHLCVNKQTSIASDNGLSPGRRQAIIWNNAGILLIGPLGTNFSEILIEIQTFSLKKICWRKYRVRDVGHFVSASMC